MKTLLTFVFLFAMMGTVVIAQNTSKYNDHSGKIVSLSGVVSDRASVLTEGFEGGTMPPTNWSVVSGPTPYTWTADNTGTPPEGTWNADCQYDDTYSGHQHEVMKSPAIDLTTGVSATLTFYFMMSEYWGIDPYDNYDLHVAVSIDNGVTFNDTVWNEIDTDTSTWVSWDWVQASVDLTSYIGNSQVVLAFVYDGYDGAQGGLDNIIVDLATTTSQSEMEHSFINVFPNPASDVITVEVPENTRYAISDISGKIIYTGLAAENEKVDVSQYANGIYSVKIVSDEHVSVQRFVVSR